MTDRGLVYLFNIFFGVCLFLCLLVCLIVYYWTADKYNARNARVCAQRSDRGLVYLVIIDTLTQRFIW